MINGKKVLAVIPARGGSKGIPYKNIKDLAGKPLIAWTIEEAKKSRYIDRLILSSEDKDIIQVAREWGCEVPFIRPAELAQDSSPGIDTVLHAIKTLDNNYDYVVLVQPTSPLRKVVDIDGCIERCIIADASACVTVCEVKHQPAWMYTLDKSLHMHPLIKEYANINRRQELPKAYVLNGAVYVAQSDFVVQKKSFLTPETIAYAMPPERSIDIDDEADFNYCSWLMHKIRNV